MVLVLNFYTAKGIDSLLWIFVIIFKLCLVLFKTSSVRPAKKTPKNRIIKSLNVGGFLQFDCGGLFFISLMVTGNCNYV